MNDAQEIFKALNQKLPAELVTKRNIGGSAVPYIEGFRAIEQANEIFGFDGWGSELIAVQLHAVGRGLYTATARVMVTGWPAKMDIGACSVASDTPDGHDTAIKGAYTDALKRALRQFGDQFGNSLYDRDDETRTEVMTGRPATPAARQPAKPTQQQRPAPSQGKPPAPPAEPPVTDNKNDDALLLLMAEYHERVPGLSRDNIDALLIANTSFARPWAALPPERQRKALAGLRNWCEREAAKLADATTQEAQEAAF